MATDAQGHGVDTSGMYWTRPERANGVATMQGVRFYVAKRVKRVVLLQVITGVQSDGHKEHCGDHWLILKSDATNLEQKL